VYEEREKEQLAKEKEERTMSSQERRQRTSHFEDEHEHDYYGLIIQIEEDVHFQCASPKLFWIPYNCTFSNLKEKVCTTFGRSHNNEQVVLPPTSTHGSQSN